MSNEQQIAYLMSLIHGLDTAIMHTMDNLPDDLKVSTQSHVFGVVLDIKETYPVLDPILEFKESLYQQLEALKGIK